MESTESTVTRIDIPSEVWISVFHFLNTRTMLVKLSLVSRAWQGLLCFPQVWEEVDLSERVYFTGDGITQSQLSRWVEMKGLSVENCTNLSEEVGIRLAANSPLLARLVLRKCTQLGTPFARICGSEFQFPAFHVLHTLDLHASGLTSFDLAAVGMLPSLCSLNISWNEQVEDEGICYLFNVQMDLVKKAFFCAGSTYC